MPAVISPNTTRDRLHIRRRSILASVTSDKLPGGGAKLACAAPCPGPRSGVIPPAGHTRGRHDPYDGCRLTERMPNGTHGHPQGMVRQGQGTRLRADGEGRALRREGEGAGSGPGREGEGARLRADGEGRALRREEKGLRPGCV